MVYGLQDTKLAQVRIAELHRNAMRVHMASQVVRELRAARQDRAPVEPTLWRGRWLVAAVYRLRTLSLDA